MPYTLSDHVKIASELALLIALTLANTLLATIRPTIVSLLLNGVVSGHTAGSGDRSKTQSTCEGRIDRLLNHEGRILSGAIVASATLYYYVARTQGLTILTEAGSFLRILDVVLYFVPTTCYAYFVGIIVWKMFVTSFFFQSFPERYTVVPRFLHPDGACGLLPVGDLC